MEINRKQFGKMQYRAAFGPFLNVFNVLKLKIQEEHRDIIKGTLFWGLFKAYDGGLVSDDMCRKTYVDIIRIINCFIAETSEFKFGDGCEKLTRFEIDELLGLPSFGRDINLNEHCLKSDEGFIKRNFKTVDRVTRQNIESAMITIVTGKTQQNREDFMFEQWRATIGQKQHRIVCKNNWSRIVENHHMYLDVLCCCRLCLCGDFDINISDASESHMNRSLRCEPHIMVSPHRDNDQDFFRYDVNDVHKTPAIGILKSKFRSYESQQPIAARKSLAKNMTSSVTVASVTSEKKIFRVANHRLTTGVSGGSNFDEIQTKEVVSTTSKKEFNPSKMFQLISSQDNLFHKGLSECELVEAHHVPKNSELSVEQRLEKERSENKSLKEEIKKLKIEVEVAQVHSVVYHEMCCDTEALFADAYNQYDDLSSDLTELFECIEKEMGENKHASSPEIATWIVRLKRKQREPKKAKLNEIVPSVVNPAENDEIVDTTKGKAQIGSEAIGRHTVKGKQRIGITLDPSCMSVWMYLSNEEQDRMHQDRMHVSVGQS
ncbi:hypothetical protein D8674_009986 [Pyrus ussuriensis x Pyrus communis]|uniref:Uncharacterized protein n=1 Tax=Pyrus ussuriensis x Pyrus communis TaxID=2448454 RepID=A0A5N5F9J1_9ROSA|nr:hypothetical protein D8674_009986 [Pyrus ussuriensis x Pyrus communis]